MPAAKKKADGYKVVAPLVAVKTEGGVSQLFAGDVVPSGATRESIDHLLELGFIVEADVVDDSTDEK